MDSNTTSINYKEYCSNRLPCGLCMITNSPCPYTTYTEISWSYKDYITCKDHELKI